MTKETRSESILPLIYSPLLLDTKHSISLSCLLTALRCSEERFSLAMTKHFKAHNLFIVDILGNIDLIYYASQNQIKIKPEHVSNGYAPLNCMAVDCNWGRECKHVKQPGAIHLSALSIFDLFPPTFSPCSSLKF